MARANPSTAILNKILIAEQGPPWVTPLSTFRAADGWRPALERPGDV